MDEAGYQVGNLDCTIIAQKPKLSPHKVWGECGRRSGGLRGIAVAGAGGRKNGHGVWGAGERGRRAGQDG